HVRRIRRLVLATQHGGDLRRQAAQRLALGVDDIPATLDFRCAWRVRPDRHGSIPYSQFERHPSSESSRLSSYRTRQRTSPSGGAGSPAIARSFERNTSCSHSTSRPPWATVTIELTIVRTICGRKPSASIRNSCCVPSNTS